MASNTSSCLQPSHFFCGTYHKIRHRTEHRTRRYTSLDKKVKNGCKANKSNSIKNILVAVIYVILKQYVLEFLMIIDLQYSIYARKYNEINHCKMIHRVQNAYVSSNM